MCLGNIKRATILHGKRALEIKKTWGFLTEERERRVKRDEMSKYRYRRIWMDTGGGRRGKWRGIARMNKTPSLHDRKYSYGVDGCSMGGSRFKCDEPIPVKMRGEGWVVWTDIGWRFYYKNKGRMPLISGRSGIFQYFKLFSSLCLLTLGTFGCCPEQCGHPQPCQMRW